MVDQGPDPAPLSDAESGSRVTTLTVAGKTEQRVAAWATALADWMDGDGAGVPLADIAHTVNLYRSRHNKFATVSARDREEAVAHARSIERLKKQTVKVVRETFWAAPTRSPTSST